MISVIIPVYNEEKTISSLLDVLCLCTELDIVVVDGQSTDNTRQIVRGYPVQLVESSKKRSIQMNDGADHAHGDVLIFLHADSIIEEKSLASITDAINKGFIGGCLSQRIDSDKVIYRAIESSGNFRAKLSKIFYGDQAIFVKRDVFFDVEGYPEVDLFEDVMFSRKLRKKGKVCVLGDHVLTSSRRWHKQGLIKTTAINWFIGFAFMIGVPPKFLRKIYKDIR